MRIRYYLFVVLLSCLPMASLFFTADMPHTSDGLMHLARIAAYYKELRHGQFPVRWASELNYGYGTPIFNFFHPLPYILAAPLVWVGIDLVTIFKILSTLSYVLGGVFMFALIERLTGNNTKALIVSIFYQFAPFRLVEILVRGSLGGIFGYTFLPLVLYGIVRLAKTPSVGTFTFAAVSMAFLATAHNIISFVFTFLIALFILIYYKSWNIRLMSAAAIGAGLLLVSFYWIPAIAEHSYTYGALHTRDLFRTHFAPIQNFLLPNFTNEESLRTAEISTQLGIFHVLALVLALFYLFTKKHNANTKKLLIFSLVATALTFFFMLNVSWNLWEYVAVIRQFQYPWRLLSIICFTSALASLSFFESNLLQKKGVLFGITFLTVISTIHYWKPTQGFYAIQDADYWAYPLTTTYYGETDVIWSAGPAGYFPASPVEVIEGNATIDAFNKNSVRQSFVVRADIPSTLVSNTQYFPGWRAYIDNEKIPIEFQNQLYRGLITFHVPPGTHNVRIEYEGSKIQIMSNVLSVITASVLCMLLLGKNLQKFTLRRRVRK